MGLFLGCLSGCLSVHPNLFIKVTTQTYALHMLRSQLAGNVPTATGLTGVSRGTAMTASHHRSSLASNLTFMPARGEVVVQNERSQGLPVDADSR